MGCINSKKEQKEMQTNSNRVQNVYRVFACRILVESGTVESGYLELSPKELSFCPEVGETIKWALQHLRRYGCTGDVFSFEAGRRCMTGPGIYTFRCHNAENMHQLFQSYINTVARTDETAPMVCTDFPASIYLTTLNSHDTYLEPTIPISSTLYNRSIFIRRDSAYSSPLSSNLNSPSSFQGVNLTNEVIHLNGQPSKHSYPNSNLYQEFLIKPNEFNNNIPSRTKTQDVPPQEIAPNIQNLEVDILHPRNYLASNEQHMYENVNGLEESASSERCYENFSSIDLPVLTNEKTKTPINESSAVVNYITLDLVQSPTSTDSFSLKVKQNIAETSTTSNVNTRTDINKEIGNTNNFQECPGNKNLYTRTSAEVISNNVNTSNDNQSSMGYSTIDFIKTCALIKSVPACDVDCQESRITRHSTCVLKNSSLSD